MENNSSACEERDRLRDRERGRERERERERERDWCCRWSRRLSASGSSNWTSRAILIKLELTLKKKEIW